MLLQFAWRALDGPLSNSLASSQKLLSAGGKSADLKFISELSGHILSHFCGDYKKGLFFLRDFELYVWLFSDV